MADADRLVSLDAVLAAITDACTRKELSMGQCCADCDESIAAMRALADLAPARGVDIEAAGNELKAAIERTFAAHVHRLHELPPSWFDDEAAHILAAASVPLAPPHVEAWVSAKCGECGDGLAVGGSGQLATGEIQVTVSRCDCDPPPHEALALAVSETVDPVEVARRVLSSDGVSGYHYIPVPEAEALARVVEAAANLIDENGETQWDALAAALRGRP